MKRSYSAMLTLLCSLVAFCATGQSISGTTTICVSSSAALTGSPGGGTWSSSAPGIANVILSAGIFTGISSGTAVLTYTSSAGAATTIVTVNPLPAAVTGAATVCTGATVNLADATAGGTWISGNVSVATINTATGSVGGVAVGAVTMTYTLPTGCIATKTLTVNPSPAPISGPGSLCVGSAATYTSSPGGGIWSSSNPSVATASAAAGATTTVTGVGPGVINLVYILTSIGCISTTSVTVNATPGGPVSGPDFVCAGNTIALSAAAGGGTWTASNANATVSAAGVVTGVTTGTVTISYTTTGLCGPATATHAVTVNPVPDAIAGSSVLCTGQDVTYTHTSAGGTWSSSAPLLGSINAGTGVASGIAAGTITLSYTLAPGCIATRLITVSPSPSAISGTASVCAGSTTTLSASPAGGNWISTNTAIATIDGTTGVMSGVATGSTLIYYILGGCLSSRAATVGATTGAISGPTNVCIGTTANLAVPAAGGVWSTSNSNATVSAAGVVSGVAAGPVTISYALSGACGAAMATYAITVDPAPAAITGAAAVCQGATTTLSHSTTGGTWSSANPATATIDAATGVVTGMSAGTVTLSYTLPSGCVTSRLLSVNALPAISGAAAVCTGSSTSYSGMPAGGTWVSGTTTAGSIDASGVFTGIAAGITIVYYIVPTGCLNSMTVTVSAGSGGAGPISGPANVCNGSSITLTDATTGGTWSAGNTNASVSAGGVVTGLNAGTVVITYAASGSCGLTTATTVVTIDPAPGVIGGPASVCQGSAITATNSLAGGIWTSGMPAIAGISSTGGVVAGYAAGLSMITYNVAGCITTKAITVNPQPAPITGTIAVCLGSGSTLASATAGGTWSSSNIAAGTIDAVTAAFSGLSTGTTTVSYTLAGSGCARTVMVTVSAMSAGTISGPLAVCTGNTISLTEDSSGGTWSSAGTNATISATGVVTGVTAGTATISYTVAGSCTAATTAVITINALPAAITGPWLLCTGNPASFASATAGGSWTSSDPAAATIDATSGTATGINFGTATITYTLPTGCTATTGVTVNVLSAGTITGPAAVCTGSNITLAGSVTGGIWLASNTNATVNPTGMVSGIAAGTVTISYAVSASCGTDTATTTVTVSPAPAAISGPHNVYTGNTISLVCATTGGTWLAAPAGIATIDAATGVLTGIAPGTATVAYTIGSCAVSYTVTVSMATAGVAGVNTNSGAINCYPNPAHASAVNIQWSDVQPGTAAVQLTDISGRQVYSTSVTLTTATGHLQLDLGMVKAGMYLMNINTAAINYSSKLVIQQ